jgi:Protein of unknown function (DUF3515)
VPPPTRSRSVARLATAVALPVALAVGALTFWVLGRARPPATPAPTPTPAVTAPVVMAARPLPADAAAQCRTLVAGLPDAVRGAARRPVTAGAEQNAAYGEPPLTFACGSAPVIVGSTETVWPISGVCWVFRPASGGTAWITVDRSVPVTVTVPGPAEGSGQWAAEFAAAVAATIPRAGSAPEACR